MSLTVHNHLEYTPQEAYQRCLDGSVILDIRPEVICLYKAFDVPDVLYSPWTELPDYIDRLPVDREIIVADSTGVHGREAIDLLLASGLKRVAGLAGGMVEWERDGLPVRLDNRGRLTGSCMCQLRFRERG